MTDILWPKPQPIETAPHDMGKVLAYCDDYGWETLYSEGRLWFDIDDKLHFPTYWLPLPPDPDTTPAE